VRARASRLASGQGLRAGEGRLPGAVADSLFSAAPLLLQEISVRDQDQVPWAADGLPQCQNTLSVTLTSDHRPLRLVCPRTGEARGT
jgi:hypothetical protein